MYAYLTNSEKRYKSRIIDGGLHINFKGRLSRKNFRGLINHMRGGGGGYNSTLFPDRGTEQVKNG